MRALSVEADLLLIASWRDLPPEEVLFGCVITENAVIQGSEGLSLYRQHGTLTEEFSDGRFVGVFGGGDNLIVKTDLTGQELLYLYQSGTSWGLSNSLLLLAEDVRAQGHALTPYRPALSQPVDRGPHSQPLTERTVFTEIRLLSATSFVEISTLTKSISIHRRSLTRELRTQLPDDPRDAFVYFLEQSISTLRTISGLGSPVYCDLSGGLDSRAVFGIAQAAGITGRNFSLRSFAHEQPDYAVAKDISGHFGVSLTDEVPTGWGLGVEDAYRLWLLSSVGGYAPLRPKLTWGNVEGFRLSGDLAASNKFGNSQLWRFVASSTRSHGTKGLVVGADMIRSSSFHGIGPKREGRALFYSLFRSRFHSGRNWFRRPGQPALLTPLVSSGFLNLYRLAQDRKVRLDTIVPEIISLTNPKLLEWPHANPQHSWILKDFSESIFRGQPHLSLGQKKLFSAPPSNSHKKSIGADLSALADIFESEAFGVKAPVLDLRVDIDRLKLEARKDLDAIRQGYPSWQKSSRNGLSRLLHLNLIGGLMSGK